MSNTDEQRAKVKAYYVKNRDRILEYNRQYHEAHWEQVREYNKAYKAAHRLTVEWSERKKVVEEELRQFVQTLTNDEEIRKQTDNLIADLLLAKTKSLPDITKESKKTKTNTQNRRRRILESLGSICIRCGFADPRALQVDHISGNGRKHMEMFTSTRSYYSYVLRHPEEFQLLCANCNWIKRVENKEYRQWVPK